ncbi:uncharacterized protein LOC126843473 [Adelges cooleyi]|uniref:uncharacterized protein LOC126843473 n=1 Tax=Adelges cooleyi TaxID=133065 RepID=UPI00217FA950|nr:uncharacterized protein LOC126843473 [Adelges cooleyi]
METLILILTSLVIFLANTFYGQRTYFPNLPVGEYKIKIKGAFICNESVNYPIRFKLHTSRVTKTKTVLTGNISMRIPFDDNLDLHLNMAVLDKIGGWKDNAFVYRKPKACTNLKNLMGNVWVNFINSFNRTQASCPLPVGTFIMHGFDLALLENMNFPKQFFYGTYKLKVFYTDPSDVLVGCVIIVIEYVRPWEYNYNM